MFSYIKPASLIQDPPIKIICPVIAKIFTVAIAHLATGSIRDKRTIFYFSSNTTFLVFLQNINIYGIDFFHKSSKTQAYKTSKLQTQAYKTSKLQTQAYKTSKLQTQAYKTSALKNIGLQNGDATKRRLTQRQCSKRYTYEMPMLKKVDLLNVSAPNGTLTKRQRSKQQTYKPSKL